MNEKILKMIVLIFNLFAFFIFMVLLLYALFTDKKYSSVGLYSINSNSANAISIIILVIVGIISILATINLRHSIKSSGDEHLTHKINQYRVQNSVSEIIMCVLSILLLIFYGRLFWNAILLADTFHISFNRFINNKFGIYIYTAKLITILIIAIINTINMVYNLKNNL